MPGSSPTPRRPEIEAAAIVSRIRSRLHDVVTHPGLVVVTARKGHVTLHGSVLEGELDALLAAARHVPGVRTVVNELELFTSEDALLRRHGEVMLEDVHRGSTTS